MCINIRINKDIKFMHDVIFILYTVYYKNLWGEYMILNKDHLMEVVFNEVNNVQVIDSHTHLFSKDFNELISWGIDELLTENDIVTEFFKYSNVNSENFFKLSKEEQADLVWNTLFIEHSPLSESQKSIITILSKLGLNTSKDLNQIRKYFSSIKIDEHINKVLEAAGVKQVVMSYNPLNEIEGDMKIDFHNIDPRFKASLDVSDILNSYKDNYKKLRKLGYCVSNRLDARTIEEINRFLLDWAEKVSAIYLFATLPPDFFLPEAFDREKIMKNCIMPVCRELQIPFAMMIGTKKICKDSNELTESLGRARLEAVEYMCIKYPENKFLVTMLSRENQHELAVAAKRFKNLDLFGCWWFLSDSALMEETIRIRMESLGLSFIPGYSDASVLEQLIAKWDRSRKVISKVLFHKYSDLLEDNWTITEEQIKIDVEYFLNGGIEKIISDKYTKAIEQYS